DDGGIGQRWEDITSVADVVSPMIYASHYDPGWFGLDDPGERPDVVVRRALEDALERSPGRVVVRPGRQECGCPAQRVRAQSDVAEEMGLGWLLWNAAAEGTVGALESE